MTIHVGYRIWDVCRDIIVIHKINEKHYGPWTHELVKH